MTRLLQHQREIQRNRLVWETKPLLREIYADFYRHMISLIDPQLEGQIVEIGSGLGNLKAHLPQVICSDLFDNPWLDMICDGYELPFIDGSLSHILLFDVFHHLQAPNAFLKEARRVLTGNGRLIIYEPYISAASYPVYGFFHHEPVNWTEPINLSESMLPPLNYFTAQGNATRMFFLKEIPSWPVGWKIYHAEAFSCFHYLLSGGYSKPALYPASWRTLIQKCDTILSRWPRLFAGRCLVGMQRAL